MVPVSSNFFTVI